MKSKWLVGLVLVCGLCAGCSSYEKPTVVEPSQRETVNASNIYENVETDSAEVKGEPFSGYLLADEFQMTMDWFVSLPDQMWQITVQDSNASENLRSISESEVSLGDFLNTYGSEVLSSGGNFEATPVGDTDIASYKPVLSVVNSSSSDMTISDCVSAGYYYFNVGKDALIPALGIDTNLNAKEQLNAITDMLGNPTQSLVYGGGDVSPYLRMVDWIWVYDTFNIQLNWVDMSEYYDDVQFLMLYVYRNELGTSFGGNNWYTLEEYETLPEVQSSVAESLSEAFESYSREMETATTSEETLESADSSLEGGVSTEAAE